MTVPADAELPSRQRPFAVGWNLELLLRPWTEGRDAEIEQIGYTHERARHPDTGVLIPKQPIYAARVGHGPVNVWLVAEQHGDEPTSGWLAWDTFAILAADPRLKWMQKELTGWFYLQANPLGRILKMRYNGRPEPRYNPRIGIAYETSSPVDVYTYYNDERGTGENLANCWNLGLERAVEIAAIKEHIEWTRTRRGARPGFALDLHSARTMSGDGGIPENFIGSVGWTGLPRSGVSSSIATKCEQLALCIYENAHSPENGREVRGHRLGLGKAGMTGYLAAEYGIPAGLYEDLYESEKDPLEQISSPRTLIIPALEALAKGTIWDRDREAGRQPEELRMSLVRPRPYPELLRGYQPEWSDGPIDSRQEEAAAAFAASRYEARGTGGRPSPTRGRRGPARDRPGFPRE